MAFAPAHCSTSVFHSTVIEAPLARVQENLVSAAYNRALNINLRRDMMQKYYDFLDSLKYALSI